MNKELKFLILDLMQVKLLYKVKFLTNLLPHIFKDVNLRDYFCFTKSPKLLVLKRNIFGALNCTGHLKRYAKEFVGGLVNLKLSSLSFLRNVESDLPNYVKGNRAATHLRYRQGGGGK